MSLAVGLVFYRAKGFLTGNSFLSMRNKIKAEIGFSDGEFASYERKGDELTVLVDAWNGTRLALVFSQFEGALDLGLGDVSDFVEETEPDGFFDQVISRIYTEPPEKHPYHYYQFLDLDDQPVLVIVASDVRIVSA